MSQSVELVFEDAGVRTIVSSAHPLPTSSAGGGGGTSDATAANQALEIASLQVIDDLPIAQATALGTIKQVMVGGSVTTAAPTYTTGQINPLSLDTSGRLRVTSTTTTVTYKILATGQLANAKGTLYTVPASTVAHVRFFRAVSTGAAQTVKVYTKKSGGTSRLAGPYAVLGTGEAYVVLTEGEQLDLAAGDIIEGEATTAATVDYTISGSEEV